MSLSSRDEKYFTELADKYRNFKKPTETQSMLVELYDKVDKTEADYRKVSVLLLSERHKQHAFDKKQALNKLLKKDKEAERKSLERRKFTLGGGVLRAMTENIRLNDSISYKDIAQDMYNKKLITLKDMQQFRDFFPNLSYPPETKKVEEVASQAPNEPTNQH